MLNYQYQPTCQIPPKELDRIYTEAFGFKKDGVFCEIGSHDGWHWSNTWGLAEIGWHGVYVEPVRDLYEQCVQTNAKRPWIDVDHCCVGSYNGTKILGMAEYGASADAKDGAFEARQLTLDTLLFAHNFKSRFDLLVIDVEGSEADVLAGFTFQKWLPNLIIAERPPVEYDCLLDLYQIVYSDWINTAFRRKE